MSDTSQGPGSWLANDGKWYPPELHPTFQSPKSPTEAETSRPDGWWLASDGRWYPPERHSGLGPAAHPISTPVPSAGSSQASHGGGDPEDKNGRFGKRQLILAAAGVGLVIVGAIGGMALTSKPTAVARSSQPHHTQPLRSTVSKETTTTPPSVATSASPTSLPSASTYVPSQESSGGGVAPTSAIPTTTVPVVSANQQWVTTNRPLLDSLSSKIETAQTINENYAGQPGVFATIQGPCQQVSTAVDGLSSVPPIPDANVNAQWNAVVGQIKQGVALCLNGVSQQSVQTVNQGANEMSQAVLAIDNIFVTLQNE